MDAKQTINALRNFPINQSIMLSAKHGVGKSSVVEQVALEDGGICRNIRLAYADASEIRGLPFLDVTAKETCYLKQSWWPRDPNSRGTLFFDEINRANRDVLQTVFEICLDRRLDGEPLPDGWRVVAAINADDDYQVNELDYALYDRWFHINFDPTVQEWIEWATERGLHSSVIEFINQNPDQLDPPISQMEPGKVYPSRRSWERFDEACKALDLFRMKDEGLLTLTALGWVGQFAAAAFPRFLNNEYSRIKASDVLDNFALVRDKIKKAEKDIEVLASLTNSVMTEIKVNRKELTDKNENNLKGFFLGLPREIGSSFWTQALRTPLMVPLITNWARDPDSGLREYIRGIFSNDSVSG